MRIISWNAQGKFREKFPEIRKLSGDIYIIQECENNMKRLFIKALKIKHQQEVLFVLGIFSCIIGAILFEYDKLKHSETCMGICLICFILLLINAWLNPYIKKSLNKNYMSIADGDDYVEAKQVMRGNGKDHYLGLSQKKRKKSLLGRIK